MAWRSDRSAPVARPKPPGHPAVSTLMATKHVSLFLELTELQGVLEAARTLAVQLQGEPAADQPASLGVEIGAVLALAIERMRLVRAAIEGAVDPVVVLARHNVVVDGPGPGRDILLPVARRRR